jgi:hypothetical protein
MAGTDLHYIVGGLIVLIGSIALIKVFDFLAAQGVKRILDMANGNPVD